MNSNQVEIAQADFDALVDRLVENSRLIIQETEGKDPFLKRRLDQEGRPFEYDLQLMRIAICKAVATELIGLQKAVEAFRGNNPIP